MPLNGAPGHPNEAAYLTVCQVQGVVQNQNALLRLRQSGESLGYKRIVDMWVVPVLREHDAVAGVTIHDAELVQFCLRQVAEEGFTLSLAFHVPQVGSGLVSQYLLAKKHRTGIVRHSRGG